MRKKMKKNGNKARCKNGNPLLNTGDCDEGKKSDFSEETKIAKVENSQIAEEESKSGKSEPVIEVVRANGYLYVKVAFGEQVFVRQIPEKSIKGEAEHLFSQTEMERLMDERVAEFNADLVALCEDNEVMREAIIRYFEARKVKPDGYKAKD